MSLFTKDDDYTEESVRIVHEFERAVEEIFNRYPEHSRRELAVLGYSAVGMIECKQGFTRRKKKTDEQSIQKP